MRTFLTDTSLPHSALHDAIDGEIGTILLIGFSRFFSPSFLSRCTKHGWVFFITHKPAGVANIIRLVNYITFRGFQKTAVLWSRRIFEYQHPKERGLIVGRLFFFLIILAFGYRGYNINMFYFVADPLQILHNIYRAGQSNFIQRQQHHKTKTVLRCPQPQRHTSMWLFLRVATASYFRIDRDHRYTVLYTLSKTFTVDISHPKRYRTKTLSTLPSPAHLYRRHTYKRNIMQQYNII